MWLRKIDIGEIMNPEKKNRSDFRYKGNCHSTYHTYSRKKKGNERVFVIVGFCVILCLIFVIIGIRVFHSSQEKGSESSVATLDEQTDVIVQNAVIDLSGILPQSASSESKTLSIKGLTPGEISEAIQDSYSWSLRLVNPQANVGSTVLETVDADATTEAATMGDEDNPDGINTVDSSGESASEDTLVTDAIYVPDFIEKIIPDFVSGIVEADNEYKNSLLSTAPTETKGSGLFSGGETETSSEMDSVVYELSLDTDDFSDDIDTLVEEAATMWYVEPQGGSINAYDPDTDSFSMESSKTGFRVDTDLLREDILTALRDKDYSASVEISGETLRAESNITVGEYGIIGTFSTKTSANSVRNKNIQLACEALNGTILRPGEEFSFNDVVGERTEEKGYGAATAYNNGEVVQEIGGGVCQVSTTLYNAVTKAGLKTTFRQSHTFKPNYVTPGLDATISWGGPDYKFANIPANAEYSNSQTYAIGIKASYWDNTVTISIYSRPVLKDGYSYELSSTKERDLDMVRVQIVPGDGREPTSGSTGSIWNVNLVVSKDGEVVSDALDHRAIYSGHTEYYYEVQPIIASSDEAVSQGNAVIGDEPVLSESGVNDSNASSQAESGGSAPSNIGSSTLGGDETSASFTEPLGPGENSTTKPSGNTGSSGPGSDSGSSSLGGQDLGTGGGIVAPDGPGSI